LATSLGFIHPVETTSVAVYGETTFDLADSLRLITGIRYTHDEKEINGAIQVVLEADGSTLATIPSPSGSDSWEEVTWRFGLEYDLSDNTMLYATYNRGFRSGAYESSTSVTGVAVEPEIADAYEIGFKSNLLDTRVRLNAALFYTDYKDLQVFLSTGGTSFLLNAGSADILGAELDLSANITDELSISLGLNILDTEYSEFVDVDNCTIRTGTTTVEVACSPEGNKIALAPDLTLNLGMHYETTVGFGMVGASLNYSWSDEFNWSFIGRLQEDAYGVLSGQLFWETEDERYGIALYGRNLTDEEYSTFSVAQASVGDHYAAAAPRTYGVEFKFKF
jgi:iron complex outermembrane recepter protein